MNVLFAWEWGSGLSHLLRFQPLAKVLVDQGHRLVVASRDLSHVRRVFPPAMARICQSPTFTGKLGTRLQFPQKISDLAWNLGFDSSIRIAAQVEAYRDLMTAHRIDLVISDFGLSASIAAAGLGLKRIRIGTGYECPPPGDPLPAMQNTDRPRTGVPECKEAEVLTAVNQALESMQLETFDRFEQIVGERGHTLLATLPEVDPYRGAEDREYLGVWDHSGAAEPEWPSGPGTRVFAYLKPFPLLPKLLETLQKMHCRLALVSDGIPPDMIRAGGDHVRVQQRPVDLVRAAEQCAFAITNSTHGTTLQMLSRGVPVIGFPLFMEQRIVARNLDQQRLALHMTSRGGDHLHEAILRAQSDAAHRAVGAFAERVRPFLDGSETRAIEKLLSLI